MEKDKNLKKCTIYEGPKLTKIKNICSGSNLKRLRTVEAHPTFTGSYKKKSVESQSELDSDSTLLGFGFGLAGV